MLTTLKATVEGDKLRWQDLPDPPLPPHEPVPVLVTLVNGNDGASSDTQAQRRVAALKKLAALSALPGIQDPVAWQRDTREDRGLPDRDS